jgi:hypothetical protein
MASIQLSLQQVLAVTQAGALRTGDTGFAVYLRNPDPESGYQHVVYNVMTQLFENGTNCQTTINEQLTSLHNVMAITNVHTSAVGGGNFPSTVTIHNHSAVPVTYGLEVYDAGGVSVSGSAATLTSNSGLQNCIINRRSVRIRRCLFPFQALRPRLIAA